MDDEQLNKESFHLTNKYIYILTITLIIFIFAYIFLDFTPLKGNMMALVILFLVNVFINYAICSADSRILEQAGIKAPHAVLGLMFIPLYLLLRAIRLRKKDRHISELLWVVVFILFNWVIPAVSQPILTHSLERDACQLVTRIVNENFKWQGVTCITVNITEQIKTDSYNAITTLSNGKIYPVKLELSGNGYLSVMVEPDE